MPLANALPDKAAAVNFLFVSRPRFPADNRRYLKVGTGSSDGSVRQDAGSWTIVSQKVVIDGIVCEAAGEVEIELKLR